MKYKFSSVAQSCPTLCNPKDCSTLGFPNVSITNPPLSITNSQSLLKLMFVKSVMPSNHLISVIPFSFCFQSFWAPWSFLMSWLFISGGQSIGASALVLSIKNQGWFPLGLTGWISLLSRGLSRVFSSTTVQKHQFFGTQPSIWSNFHIRIRLPWWLRG